MQYELNECNSGNEHNEASVWGECCGSLWYSIFHSLQEKCHQYWPAERSARYQYFVVDPMAEYNMPQYILREFKVTDARVSRQRFTERSLKINIWHCGNGALNSVLLFQCIVSKKSGLWPNHGSLKRSPRARQWKNSQVASAWFCVPRNKIWMTVFSILDGERISHCSSH